MHPHILRQRFELQQLRIDGPTAAALHKQLVQLIVDRIEAFLDRGNDHSINGQMLLQMIDAEKFPFTGYFVLHLMLITKRTPAFASQVGRHLAGIDIARVDPIIQHLLDLCDIRIFRYKIAFLPRHSVRERRPSAPYHDLGQVMPLAVVQPV
ncbi:hypothetical protein D3C84_963420 [compost metagenome]